MQSSGISLRSGQWGLTLPMGKFIQQAADWTPAHDLSISTGEVITFPYDCIMVSLGLHSQ